MGFPGCPVIKNLLASAGGVGDVGSIPGWCRSPRVGNGNLLLIFAWEISWREEPGGLQSMKSQRVTQNWATKHIICNIGQWLTPSAF